MKSKNNKTAKETIKKSWQDFIEAWKNLWKTVWNTTKWIYHAIDAWDKAIWSWIKDRRNKIVNWAKNNILKLLIAWSILTYWWIKSADYLFDDNKDKQEEENTINTDNTINFSTMEKNIYRNQDIFFEKDLDQKIANNKTIEKLWNWIILLHDAWLTFYLMVPEDIQEKSNNNSSRTNTIEFIRNKLGNIPQFSYLQNDIYKPTNNVVTNSFNIRPDFKEQAENSTLNKYPFWIPIPIKKEIREISNENFNISWENAIDIIGEYNKDYEYIRNKVSEEYSKENIAKLLTSIALVETGKTTKTIWVDTYHRRETWSHDCFSFGPSHVLMEHGWLKSRKNLWVTEWQMYHPTISNMVVMWFMIEKIKETWTKDKDAIAKKLINMLNFIDDDYIKPDNQNLNKFCKFYNWGTYKSNNYHEKITTALNWLNIDDKFMENTDAFEFEGINSAGSHLVYSYQIVSANENDSIWKNNSTIRKEFKNQYDIESNNILVCRNDWSAYSDNIIHGTGKTIYVKFPISSTLNN